MVWEAFANNLTMMPFFFFPASDSSSDTMRVRYRTIWMDLPIADCDTTELEDVLKTIRFDKSNKKRPRWVKIPDRFQGIHHTVLLDL